MAWWIYKCNNRQHEHQVVSGDWREFFDKAGPMSWGSTEWVSALGKLQSGDMIIAYQSERNELVGLAQVHRLLRRKGHLVVYLKPIEKIGCKVLPLKKAYRRIKTIPALAAGPIKTIYDISASDAKALLRAARLAAAAAAVAHERAFREGEKRAGETTVRNASLRAAAKKYWGLRCYCCGFDFAEFYGPRAAGAAIVHHLDTFESAAGKHRKTTVQDVRVICANCHYVIHRTDPPLAVNKLKQLLSKSWQAWSPKGVSRKRK